ncbi:MAG: DUF1501 domain-containing protein [Planctomycetota bacterium]
MTTDFFDRPSIGRREFLGRSFIGISAAGALTGYRTLRAAVPPGKRGQAQRVLVLFEQGGLSHIDTFDPKPELPTEHRSPFPSIPTNVPGVHFTSLLEKTAKHMDKLSVVRCMTQPTPGVADSHSKGSQYIYSGEAPGGPVTMPDIGSVVSARLGSEARYLPSYVMVPGNSEQGDQTKIGFLPPAHKVFKTGGNLSRPGWTVPNLGLIGGIDAKRFRDRRDLLSNLDVGLLGAAESKKARTVESIAAQADDMLSNPLTREAFDLESEPDKLRDRYGRGHRGQCYMVGRKLVEAGVRYVIVDVREPSNPKYPGGSNMNWDHHDFIYSKGSTAIKGGGAGAGRWGIGTWPMMGSTDQAFSALLEDMDQRGLLEDTLVCFVTEFGRTPKINNRKGRDHWTYSFTHVFAGAGVPGGQVVGSTDRDGGYITSSMSYTIEDYAATLYEKLGVDREKPIYTPSDRPIFLAKEGSPISELFA